IVEPPPTADVGELFTDEPIDEPFTDEPIDVLTAPPASAEEPTIPVATADAEAIPEPAGEVQELEMTGIVPDGAQTARISIHVNGDEICCAEADLTLYELGYLEDDPEGTTVAFTNLFASEGDWASTGDGGIVITGSDLDDALMLRVFAAEDESVGIDAPFFEVHGATTFHATLRLRVAPWSGGSSLALVRFFADGTEVGMTSMELPAFE
ncbi:MAG: hypothetical protein ABUL57_02550, partial [Chloroflexota bacterium]